MDKINSYIPKPIPLPVIEKPPCNPACEEANRRFNESIMKQQQSPPILDSNSQQIQKK
jgi:hypothetical protein